MVHLKTNLVKIMILQMQSKKKGHKSKGLIAGARTIRLLSSVALKY